MAAVSISPVLNETEFLDNDGLPLAGGNITTYEGGSFTVEQTSYTSSAGDTPNSQPIELDSSGRLPAGIAIWLENGLTYNLVLRDATDTIVLKFFENVVGVAASTPGGSSDADVWNSVAPVPTYINGTSFLVSGNLTTEFALGNRVRATVDGGFLYSTVSAVLFSSPNTQVTVINDGTALDSSLSAVEWSSLIASGRTVDAGGVSYTPALAYASTNTVGSALKTVIAAEAALELVVARDEKIFTTTGTSTAYVITASPAFTSYANQGKFAVKFHTGSGSNPTLNVNGLGALDLKVYNSADAKVNAITFANQTAMVLYDGTDLVLQRPAPVAAGVSAGAEVFTSNGTFVVPTGITKLKVTCIGGGGGGGDLSGSGLAGAGGGGAIAYLTVVPADSYAVVIGAGGASGAPGGTTSFGTDCIATGGGAGGNGGIGTAGDILVAGNPGGRSGAASTDYRGAGSAFGFGPMTQATDIAGHDVFDGRLYGGGGGVSDSNFGPTPVGAQGICVIEYSA